MKKLNEFPVAELKLIYKVLHSQVQQQFELMDSELLQNLQTLLQTNAKNDGVDVTMHSEWSAWLSNENE